MPATCGRREFSGGLALRVATLPKSDRGPQENEDAAAWCLGTRRFAVADGATDAAFSGQWAVGLARHFVDSGPGLGNGELPGRLAEWLAPIQAAWRAQVPWGRLPWYLEEKAHRGGFSTLLAMELEPPPPPARGRRSTKADAPPVELGWRAAAVGDTCLFHWRREELLLTFPLRESAEFGTRPYLIGSHPDWNRQLDAHWREVRGACRPGDHFVLATDALAQWLLRELEQGRQRFVELLELDDDEAFQAWITGRRESEGLRNDDTTLLHVRVGDDIRAEGVPGSLPASPSAGPGAEPAEP